MTGRQNPASSSSRHKGRRPTALTKSFKDLVQKRVASDPAFGEALLRESIETMLTGDMDTGKSMLRYYIKAARL